MNPTDINTYVPALVAPPMPSVTPYPRWMYHPTNPAQVVFNSAQEAALIASDPQWTETDPNATN